MTDIEKSQNISTAWIPGENLLSHEFQDIHVATPSKEQITNYFQNLSHNLFDLNQFQIYWSTISRYNFEEDALILFLRNSAGTLASQKSDAKKDAIDFLANRNNISAVLQNTTIRNLHVTPSSLAEIIWSFAKLGIRPDEVFLEKFYTRCQKKMRYNSPWEIANIGWGLAKLGLNPPDDFITEWTYQTERKFKYFSRKLKPILLWSMAALSSITGHDILTEKALEFLSDKRIPTTDLSENMISQFKLAALWFGNSSFSQYKCHSTEGISNFERNLRKAFISSGAIVLSTEDSYLAELDRNPDIYIFDRKKDIMIEYDGPYHFVQDLDGNLYYDGGTKLQNALMGKLYPEHLVIRLNYLDGEHIRFNSNMDVLVEKLTAHFSATQPGVYETCIEEEQLSLIPVLHTLPAPA